MAGISTDRRRAHAAQFGSAQTAKASQDQPRLERRCRVIQQFAHLLGSENLNLARRLFEPTHSFELGGPLLGQVAFLLRPVAKGHEGAVQEVLGGGLPRQAVDPTPQFGGAQFLQVPARELSLKAAKVPPNLGDVPSGDVHRFTAFNEAWNGLIQPRRGNLAMVFGVEPGGVGHVRRPHEFGSLGEATDSFVQWHILG